MFKTHVLFLRKLLEEASTQTAVQVAVRGAGERERRRGRERRSRVQERGSNPRGLGREFSGGGRGASQDHTATTQEQVWSRSEKLVGDFFKET